MGQRVNGSGERPVAILATAAALFVALAGVYSLTYSGTFKSGDEIQFVGGVVSLGGWGQWSATPAGLSLINGNSVEPMLTLVGAGLYQLARLGHVGVVHTLFLTNVYVIALTGVVVFLIVSQRGGRPGIALGAALVFGLATLAWPQSKLYFRDPLAMFFAALALLSFERLLTRTTWLSQAAHWILTLGFLGAAIVAKNTAAFALVALLISAVVHAIVRPAQRRLMLLGLAPFALLGGIMLVIPDNGGPFSRFALAHYTNWLLRKHIGPDFVPAIVGALVSPGKGLFVESPALLLAVAAVPLTRKGERLLHLMPWLTVFGIAVGLAYDSGAVWFGGTGWGVRHLLPAVPMLAAGCAPALTAIWASRRRWIKIAAGGLIVLSVFIQVGAVLLLPDAYYAWLSKIGQVPWAGALWNPLYSEAVGYWRLLLSRGALVDLAWLRIFPVHRLAVAALVGAWVAILAAALWLLWLLLGGARSIKVSATAAALSVVALTVMPYALLRAYYPDPYYYSAGRDDYRAAADFVTGAARPGDGIVVRGSGSPLWRYFLNYVYSPVPWYTYSPYAPNNTPADAALDEVPSTPWLEPDTERLFSAILPQRQARIWQVSDQCIGWADLRLEERWLAKRYVAVSSQPFQAQCSSRVSLFALATTPVESPLSLDFRFGDAVHLTDAAQLALAGQGTLQPGGVLPVRLEWQLTQPISVDYTIGVYLLDGSGVLKAQQDGGARGDFYPMTHWPVGTPLPDQHGLQLPADLPAGDYQVAVAIYNWQTGERLPVTDSRGPVPDNLARIFQVHVAAP
jgi:hypothetical protein